MSEAGGEGGRFVWPPRSGVPAAAPPPLTASETEQVAGSASALEAFESAWLGVRALSFARAAELAGWRADDADAFCWRCGTGVGAFECDGEGCAACRAERVPWDRFVRVAAYEGLVRDSILALKFERWRRTGTELGVELGRAIARELESRGISRASAAIVPVPTSWVHRMTRGVDHTVVIARAAGRTAGVRVARALRRKHGPAQTSVPASRRTANVRGRILARRDAARRLRGVELAIVVDDIRTTGATMRAACGAVRGVIGARPDPDRERVWAGVVAVAGARDRRAGGGRSDG